MMTLLEIIGISLVAISTFLMLIFLLRKSESFFNLNNIIKKHIGLFKNCKFQYVVFYVLPFSFSVGLAMLYEAGEEFYSELNVIISILLSMLLAILSILTGRDYNNIPEKKQQEKLHAVVDETINAIIFDSLLCIFLLLHGLIMIVIDSILVNMTIIKCIFSGIGYYIFTVILLTLFLIVKRMGKIIEIPLNTKKK